MSFRKWDLLQSAYTRKFDTELILKVSNKTYAETKKETEVSFELDYSVVP